MNSQEWEEKQLHFKSKTNINPSFESSGLYNVLTQGNTTDHNKNHCKGSNHNRSNQGNEFNSSSEDSDKNSFEENNEDVNNKYFTLHQDEEGTQKGSWSSSKYYNISRSNSDTFADKQQVNISVWINHLRLNMIVKICVVITLLFLTFFINWMTDTYEGSQGKKRITIGPSFIAVNGRWHFITDIIEWDSTIFSAKFCNDRSIEVFIASCIYLFGSIVSWVVYSISFFISKLVSPFV